MAPPLLHLSGIGLTFGGAPLLTNAELSLGERERVCLVGRNGSGKSTLLRIAAGVVEPDRGTRFVQPGATIRYLPQEPDLAGFASTLAYVEAGLGPGDDPYAARRALEELGLSGKEDPAGLSGGEARRAALARVIAAAPDILLMDEPTNHLDLPTIEWLEGAIGAMRAAVVLISHDRRFLANLSRATVWLDRGETHRLEQGFAAFEAWRDDLLAKEESDRHKLDRKIAAEADWLRYGVTARRKRNVRRLAQLHALRRDKREAVRPTGAVAMGAAEADISGKLVIEAREVGKSYGARALVDRFSIRITRGDRLGIVGPNGAGKTTLIGLLSGRLEPDRGSVRLGENLESAMLDQRRDSLDPDVTLAAALTEGRGDTVMVNGAPRHVVGYLRDFLFSPEQARTPLRVLSGGERGRVMLARALARPSNLLVLDEPTNDLDLETLDVLEEMLGEYRGTLLLISHDRDFLDRIVDTVLVPEGDGRWTAYAGGYSDMLRQRGSDLARTSPVKAEGSRSVRSPPAAPAAAPKRRLDFHQKHALATLPGRITALEAEIARIRGVLDDPDLFARDKAEFDAASARLAGAEEELAQSEHRWLELEMLREELEAG